MRVTLACFWIGVAFVSLVESRCLPGPTGATGPTGSLGTVTVDILPTVNNQYDLGGPSLLFRTIYANAMYLNGTGSTTGLSIPNGGIVVGGTIVTNDLMVTAFLQSDLIPSIDNFYSLGSNTNRFKNIYAENVFGEVSIITHNDVVLNSTTTLSLTVTGTIFSAPQANGLVHNLVVNNNVIMTGTGSLIANQTDATFQNVIANTLTLTGSSFSAGSAAGTLASLTTDTLTVTGSTFSASTAAATLKTLSISQSLTTTALTVNGNATFADRINAFGGAQSGIVLNSGGPALSFYNTGQISGYFCGIWSGSPACHTTLLNIFWTRIGKTVTINIPFFSETTAPAATTAALTFCNVNTASACASGTTTPTTTWSLLPSYLLPTSSSTNLFYGTANINGPTIQYFLFRLSTTTSGFAGEISIVPSSIYGTWSPAAGSGTEQFSVTWMTT